MKCLVSKRHVLALLLVVLSLVVVDPVQAAGGKLDEYQIKAGFVRNFALLAEWPSEGRGETDVFPIAVLGKLPSATFANTLKSLNVFGKRIVVKNVDSVEEAKSARLLFISASEHGRLSSIVRELRHQSVLTVSDMNGFCEGGGMIGLVPVQNRLGYDVNIAAVRRAHLSISSQMLKLARTIHGN